MLLGPDLELGGRDLHVLVVGDVQSNQRLHVLIELPDVLVLGEHGIRILILPLPQILRGNDQAAFGQPDIPEPGREGFVQLVQQIPHALEFAPAVLALPDPAGLHVGNVHGHHAAAGHLHFRLDAVGCHCVLAFRAERAGVADEHGAQDRAGLVPLIQTPFLSGFPVRLDLREEMHADQPSEAVFRNGVPAVHIEDGRIIELVSIPVALEVDIPAGGSCFRGFLDQRFEDVLPENLVQPFLLGALSALLVILLRVIVDPAARSVSEKHVR